MATISSRLLCPDCEPGRLVWARVLDEDFFANVAMAATPMILALIIVVCVHAFLSRADRQGGGDSQQ